MLPCSDQMRSHRQWHARCVKAGFQQLPVDPAVLRIIVYMKNTFWHEEFFAVEDRGWLVIVLYSEQKGICKVLCLYSSLLFLMINCIGPSRHEISGNPIPRHNLRTFDRRPVLLGEKTRRASPKSLEYLFDRHPVLL